MASDYKVTIPNIDFNVPEAIVTLAQNLANGNTSAQVRDGLAGLSVGIGWHMRDRNANVKEALLVALNAWRGKHTPLKDTSWDNYVSWTSALAMLAAHKPETAAIVNGTMHEYNGRDVGLYIINNAKGLRGEHVAMWARSVVEKYSAITPDDSAIAGLKPTTEPTTIRMLAEDLLKRAEKNFGPKSDYAKSLRRDSMANLARLEALDALGRLVASTPADDTLSPGDEADAIRRAMNLTT